MQYEIETATRNNWALLTIADYQDAFFSLFGFIPSGQRIYKMVAQDKIDYVKHERRLYIIMNDKSTYDVKVAKSDFRVFQKTRHSKDKLIRIKDAQ